MKLKEYAFFACFLKLNVLTCADNTDVEMIMLQCI